MSVFTERLAAVAKDQLARFGGIDENDEPLFSQIKEYWMSLGLAFPGVATPWSAVFVSYCVKKAGATAAEFRFAPEHSEFVYTAINHPGAFEGLSIVGHAVDVGDIIQNNRGGSRHDFDFAKTHVDYLSHSAIVVGRGTNAGGKFAVTIGGNEGNTVREKTVWLNDDGSVLQEPPYYIALLKCRK